MNALNATNPDRASYSIAEDKAIKQGLEPLMAIFDLQTAQRMEREWRERTSPSDMTQIQAVALRLALEVERLQWLLEVETERTKLALGPNVRANRACRQAGPVERIVRLL